MIGKEGAGRRWSVGELARASGLTVRTLRHYDEIDLVVPGERTASGHRRYTGADVRRLYRVRALRQLRLSLDEIRAALDGSGDDLASLRDLHATQVRELDARAARITRLRAQVGGLLAQLNAATMPDPDQFMTTLEMISMFETYFTQEQRDRLAERRAELGEEAVDAARTEFAEVIDEAIRQQRADTPVGDPAARALARRWTALGARFGGDNERDRASARRFWDDNREDIGRQVPWPAEDFIAAVGYLDRIREAAP